jgi:hypothetical protein
MLIKNCEIPIDYFILKIKEKFHKKKYRSLDDDWEINDKV